MSRPTLFLWGAGLIGGSLGMALRRAGAVQAVIGCDPQPDPAAVTLGAVDRFVADPLEALAVADVVLLAGPVQAIIDQAATYGRHIRPGTVVTDVGSTKEAIVAAWERHLPEGAAFVGGHPLFGREVSGVANASPDLPAGRRYLLTPGARSTPAAIATVQQLAEAAGCQVQLLSPADHDRRLATTSHLPQLAATALAATALAADEADPGLLALAATGFRDTTRLAASPAEIWTDILLTNAEAAGAALTRYRQVLDDLATAIATGDGATIARVFHQANTAHARRNQP
ncbi:MAG: prephenate dehydrogenase [Mycobacterium leprae]